MSKYWIPFSTFCKVGLFTIGGGLAMLPLIEREVVEKHRWITPKEYLDLMAIAQAMPGIFAFNFAVLIGYRFNGLRGSFVTGLGTVLPSFLIILLVATLFTGFKENEYVICLFKGMRPAVVALIAVPLINSIRSSKLNLTTGLLALAATVVISYANLNPIYIIITALMGGIAYGKWNVRRETSTQKEEEKS